MTAAEFSDERIIRRLAELRHQFLLTDLGESPSCLRWEELSCLAEGCPADEGRLVHLGSCPRCASLLAAAKSAQLIDTLPRPCCVPLEGIRFPGPGSTEFPYQSLGFIDLESRRFEACEHEEDWLSHPSAIRVNIVLDRESSLFAVSLLDVPPEIEFASLQGPDGVDALQQAESHGCLELMKLLADGRPGPRAASEADRLADLLESGEMRFVLTKSRACEVVREASDHPDPMRLLEEAGVIERGCDYVLPSGIHSDTYINVGKLCHSEPLLAGIAAAFDAKFRDVEFDCIVAYGWAMATIGRRLATRRQRRTSRPVREVLCEGYDPPIPAEDIAPRSRVLLLSDVAVTGTLLSRLSALVYEAGAVPVASGCLVDARASGGPGTSSLRSLCRVSMTLDEPEKCPRCTNRERREFNPYACCMMRKAPEPRSPSQFITQNREALEFWKMIDAADAYEHHRVERDCHYTAFVDTAKLLEHSAFGPALIDKLRELLEKAEAPPPDVLLVPNRQRAKLLASRLADSYRATSPSRSITLVRANRRAESWHFAPGGRGRLVGANVLVVDSAAGHGRTIDQLTAMAKWSGARRAGAAVILSRLTEGCEQAFFSRLDGGFFRLYHLPVRPVVIRGDGLKLCPVCQRRAAVRNTALESGLDALERWANGLAHPRRSPASCGGQGPTAPHEEQLFLFPLPESSFLERCRESVASGVTLHSLHAAMKNGMAPLALPEIRDETIPSRNRAAMVENLPTGALEWSRGYLEHDLLHFLASGRTNRIWRASADVLARGKDCRWVWHIKDIVANCRELRSRPHPTFWNSLACYAYISARAGAEAGREIRESLEGLLEAYGETPAGDGLRQMLQVIEG